MKTYRIHSILSKCKTAAVKGRRPRKQFVFSDAREREILSSRF